MAKFSQHTLTTCSDLYAPACRKCKHGFVFRSSVRLLADWDNEVGVKSTLSGQNFCAGHSKKSGHPKVNWGVALW